MQRKRKNQKGKITQNNDFSLNVQGPICPEEGVGKAKCTLSSLMTSVKFKLNHLTYLVESQDLEGPGW